MDVQNVDVGTLTHEQRDRIMTDDTGRLAALARRLRGVRSDHQIVMEAAETVEIESALESHHLPRLAREEAAVAEDAKAIYDRADAVMRASLAAGPLMSAAEMASAAAHLPFVAERCRSWPLDDLAKAVRHSVVSADRASMYAYRECLPERLKPNVELGVIHEDPSARDRSELHRLLGVINERLRDPRYEQLRKRAIEMKIASGNLRRDAERRKDAAARASAAYPWRGPNDVPWTEGEG